MRKRILEAFVGYLIAVIGLFIGLFIIVTEAQAREDESNERDMLKTRNWDNV